MPPTPQTMKRKWPTSAQTNEPASRKYGSFGASLTTA
jgi:hypothetical protein